MKRQVARSGNPERGLFFEKKSFPLVNKFDGVASLDAHLLPLVEKKKQGRELLFMYCAFLPVFFRFVQIADGKIYSSTVLSTGDQEQQQLSRALFALCFHCLSRCAYQ